MATSFHIVLDIVTTVNKPSGERIVAHPRGDLVAVRTEDAQLGFTNSEHQAVANPQFPDLVETYTIIESPATTEGNLLIPRSALSESLPGPEVGFTGKINDLWVIADPKNLDEPTVLLTQVEQYGGPSGCVQRAIAWGEIASDESLVALKSNAHGALIWSKEEDEWEIVWGGE